MGIRGGVIVEKLAFSRDPLDPEHSSAGEVEDGGIARGGKGDRRREGEIGEEE
jgi:hypothetical protein